MEQSVGHSPVPVGQGVGEVWPLSLHRRPPSTCWLQPPGYPTLTSTLSLSLSCHVLWWLLSPEQRLRGDEATRALAGVASGTTEPGLLAGVLGHVEVAEAAAGQLSRCQKPHRRRVHRSPAQEVAAGSPRPFSLEDAPGTGCPPAGLERHGR